MFFNCKKVLNLKALSLPTVRLMSSPTWTLPASTSTSSTILLEAGRVGISVSARTTATYKFHEKSKFMQKLVNKKGAKTKKQWYKPHLGEPLEVESKRTKRGISHSHSVRLRQLSHVLYDKIIEIINTGELSQEILEKHVSITAVMMSKDMNNVNVYWQADRMDWRDVEDLLVAHSGKLRSLLISYHVLGRIPHIVFVRDKSGSNLHQLAEIFEKADYGPDYVPGVIHTDVDVDEEQDEGLEMTRRDFDDLRLDGDDSNSSDIGVSGNNAENYCDNSHDSSDIIRDLENNANLDSVENHYDNSHDFNHSDYNHNRTSNSEKYNLTDVPLEGINDVKDELIKDNRINKSLNYDTTTTTTNANSDLHFRTDLYGLDRDGMMKKILAKKSKSTKSDNKSPTFSGLELESDGSISPPLALDLDPSEIPTFGSPILTKVKLQKRRAKQERKLYEKMLERDSVEF